MAQFGSVRVLGTRGRRFESCHSDYTTLKLNTPLVQLVERRFPKPDAVGSSPTGRANLFKNYKLMITLFYFIFNRSIKYRIMIRVKRGAVAKQRRKKDFKNE